MQLKHRRSIILMTKIVLILSATVSYQHPASPYTTQTEWHFVMRKWELIKQSKLLEITCKIISNLFIVKYGPKLGEFNITTGTERVNFAILLALLLSYILSWAGMVGAVGKISAFRPQDPQFDPRLCRDLNWLVRFSFPPKLTQLSILPG